MFQGTKTEHFEMFCQNSTEHFFGAERSVLTEHLDPMFPRTLTHELFILTKGCFF